MDDIDFAKTLFSDQLETLSGTKARTVAAVTEKASTTTTTIAQAMDDSSNGYVLVDLGGKTISKDATQFIDADTSETNQHAVTLPTTVTVYSGDKVMVSCIGASGTAKKVVVTGVVGGGDRISVKLSDVNELAKEIDAKVVSATTDLENTKTEMENFEKSVPNIYSTKDEITAFKENVNTTYATKKERADGDEAITTKLTTEYTNNTDLSAKYATQTLVSQTKDDITQSVSSTYATKTALNGVKSTADTNTTDLTNYITSNNKEITSLQNQIDGSIQTWFYEVVPTNDNVPASNWTTTALKNNHLGDLYYDTITGYCYRYQVANNVYGWTRITDVDVTKALADAAKAQDTADHKRRIFVTTPTVPYDVGDLWTQGSGGDVLRCKTAKTASQTYDASDWELASKYTDDTAVTALSNTVTTTYATKAEVKTTTDAISATVSDNYTKSTNYTDGKIATEVQDRNAAITEKADSITSTVSSTYATKTALATTDSKASTASSDASTALSTANSASSAAATANTNATAAKNTANTAATNASTAITTSNTAKTTADTAKSTADTAKSTADTAKATADSTANNLTNNYSTTVQMNSAITQKANEITSTVSATYTPKSDFEGLQVGARNLMLKTGTSDFQSYFNVETGTKSVSGIAMVLTATGASGTRIGYFNLSDMTVPPTSGNNYSISFDALSSVDGGKIKFNYSMTDSNGKAEFTLTTTSKRYSSKMPMSGGSTLSLLNMSAAGQVITISHIKFEAGNKPTDWSPAPEDMLSKAAAEATYATESSLTQQADRIAAEVADRKTAIDNEVTARDAAISVSADNINSFVSNTYATNTALATTNTNVTNAANAASAAQASADSVANNLSNNYSTTAQMASAINQSATNITTSVSQTYATQTSLNTTNTNVTNAANAASAAQTTANTANSTANTANTTANTANNKATYAYGICVTLAETAAKFVTLDNFLLFTGATVSVKFTYTNSVANPTLNVNSTGAKAIYANGSAMTADSPYNWMPLSTQSFVYNGTQWELVDTSTANKLSSNYSTTVQMNSAISQSATDITSEVSATYATKTALNDATSENYSTIFSDLSKQAASTQTNVFSGYNTVVTWRTRIQQTANTIVTNIEELVDHDGNISKLITYIRESALGIEVGKIGAGIKAVVNSAGRFEVMSEDGSISYSSFSASGQRTGLTSGYHTVTDSDGLHVYNGSTEVALYSSSQRVGPTSSFHTITDSTGLHVYNASNVETGFYGSGVQQIGSTSGTNLYTDSTNGYVAIRNGTTEYLKIDRTSDGVITEVQGNGNLIMRSSINSSTNLNQSIVQVTDTGILLQRGGTGGGIALDQRGVTIISPTSTFTFNGKQIHMDS